MTAEKPWFRSSITITAFALLALGGATTGHASDTAEQMKEGTEEAWEETKDAVEEGQEKAEEAWKKGKEHSKDAAEQAGDKIEKWGDKIEDETDQLNARPHRPIRLSRPETVRWDNGQTPHRRHTKVPRRYLTRPSHALPLDIRHRDRTDRAAGPLRLDRAGTRRARRLQPSTRIRVLRAPEAGGNRWRTSW